MGKDPKKKPALHEHALRFVLALAEKVWAGHARQPTGCVRLYTRSWYVPGAHAAQVPRETGPLSAPVALAVDRRTSTTPPRTPGGSTLFCEFALKT